MSAVSPQRHAALARALIKACNGLEEAAQNCRYSVTQLSRAQTPGSGTFLPADVIADLEEYAGVPHYSGAMADARPSDGSGDLADDAAEETEHAAALQATARRVRAKGRPDAADCAELRRLLHAMEAIVARVRADVDRAGCAA